MQGYKLSIHRFDAVTHLLATLFHEGGHERDFVSVEDVVKVNLHWLDHPQTSGIFNS